MGILCESQTCTFGNLWNLLYSGALAVFSGAFGDDTMSTVVQSINCYGNETEMLNCSYSTSGLETCSEHSAAVICQGKDTGLLEYTREIRKHNTQI